MTRFSGYVLFFDLVFLILAGMPAYLMIGPDVFLALLIAFPYTSLLAIISYIPFTRMHGASINKYMAAILFGMMLRMVFIALAIAFVFVYTDLHQIGFTVGLLFSYICKSMIETIILTRNHKGDSSEL